MIVEKGSDGIWSERESNQYARLMYKPNNYQNHPVFLNGG